MPKLIPDLKTLAAQANTAHAAGEAARGQYREQARVAGEALLTAKAKVPPGEWLTWLATECPDIHVRRAQRYMAMAEYFRQTKNDAASDDVLSKINGHRRKPPQRRSTPSNRKGVNEKELPPPPPADDPPKQVFPIMVTDSEKARLLELVEYLRKPLQTDDDDMTILRAVERCYEEEVQRASA